MRLGALLNDDQNCGRSPTSVGGGDCAEGNWVANTRSWGPGSVRLSRFLALIAPCGGSSGLPKELARAVVTAVAIAPAAVAVNMLRLETLVIESASDLPQNFVICRHSPDSRQFPPHPAPAWFSGQA